MEETKNKENSKGNNLLDEKVSELKTRLFMEIPNDAEFTVKQTLIIRDIIIKAVNQAVEIGRVYPALDDNYFKDAAENLNKMWEKLINPSANVKAESIGKLYHLQRYIINNLIEVIQSLHTISGVIELEGKPYEAPMNILSSIFKSDAFSSKQVSDTQTEA